MAQHFVDWREGRRFRAYELSEQGWSVTAIAEALGVTKGAVSQWLTKARDKGVEALRSVPHPGRKRRLGPEDEARLPDLLSQGAEAHGFRGDVWTRERVADVIRKHLGVRYSKWQASRIMRRVGYTRQKPGLRASQRKEADIETWQQEKLPSIQKKGG